MANIVIYGGRMGSSFRPHWMLAELGIAYETKSLDMSKGENKTPEYLAINPTGQIPTMTYDGFVLTESAAIAHYLADKHNAALLGATPEARATSLRWELFTLLNINPHFTTLALEKWGRTVPDADKAKAAEMLAKYLAVSEQWFAKNEYVAGSEFTVGDIVTRATFMYAEFISFDLSAYPSTVAWMKRCADRPAYAAAQKG